MSCEDINGLYRKQVLNEFGITRPLFLKKLLFFLLIDDGRTIDEIKEFFMLFKDIRAPCSKTLKEWAEKYSKRTFHIHDGRKNRIVVPLDKYRRISQEFKRKGYSSAREMCRFQAISLYLVCRSLKRNNMTYVNYTLVPHFLTEENKERRVEDANAMLKILHRHERNNFRSILTMDETPIYLSNRGKKGWIEEGEEVPQRLNDKCWRDKFNLTIMWGTSGFAVVDALDRKASMNTSYLCDTIFEKAIAWCQNKRKVSGATSFIFHMDNARSHTSKATCEYMTEHGMDRMPHPPYSPDLAPCDFFLFGYIKNRLIGSEFTTRDEALEKINDILNEIPEKTLVGTFREWMRRLEDVIKSGGEYCSLSGNPSKFRYEKKKF